MITKTRTTGWKIVGVTICFTVWLLEPVIYNPSIALLFSILQAASSIAVFVAGMAISQYLELLRFVQVF